MHMHAYIDVCFLLIKCLDSCMCTLNIQLQKLQMRLEGTLNMHMHTYIDVCFLAKCLDSCMFTLNMQLQKLQMCLDLGDLCYCGIFTVLEQKKNLASAQIPVLVVKVVISPTALESSAQEILVCDKKDINKLYTLYVTKVPFGINYFQAMIQRVISEVE